MASSHGASGNRLSVDDWIQAGFAILAEEGMKALKIDRLCDRPDVTKGSFYWHFNGMSSYRTALTQSWGELRDEDRRHIDEVCDAPPRERLPKMDESAAARDGPLTRSGPANKVKLTLPLVLPPLDDDWS